MYNSVQFLRRLKVVKKNNDPKWEIVDLGKNFIHENAGKIFQLKCSTINFYTTRHHHTMCSNTYVTFCSICRADGIHAQ